MASPGMFKRLNPQTGAYEYSQVLPDGTTKFYSSLDQLRAANPNFDDPGEIQEVAYNPAAPHPPTTQGGGGQFGLTGDYTADLKAYRAANPYSDNAAWMSALAPEQSQWMAQNPGQGNNPLNANTTDPTSPFYYKPTATTGGYSGGAPQSNGGGTYGSGPPPGAVKQLADSTYVDAQGRPVSWSQYGGAGNAPLAPANAAMLFNLSGVAGNNSAQQAAIQSALASAGGVTGAVNNSQNSVWQSAMKQLAQGTDPAAIMAGLGPMGLTQQDFQAIQQTMQSVGIQPGSRSTGITAKWGQGNGQTTTPSSTPGSTAPGTTDPNEISWEKQLRQNYMDSPTYNPGGANTWGIQNSPISSLNNAFGGQIGGNGQPANPAQLAQTPTQTQQPTPQLADGGTNGSQPFNSNTAFGGATSGWNPTPTPSPTQPSTPSGPTWGAQSPVQGADSKWKAWGTGANAGMNKVTQ